MTDLPNIRPGGLIDALNRQIEGLMRMHIPSLRHIHDVKRSLVEVDLDCRRSEPLRLTAPHGRIVHRSHRRLAGAWIDMLQGVLAPGNLTIRKAKVQPSPASVIEQSPGYFSATTLALSCWPAHLPWPDGGTLEVSAVAKVLQHEAAVLVDGFRSTGKYASAVVYEDRLATAQWLGSQAHIVTNREKALDRLSGERLFKLEPGLTGEDPRHIDGRLNIQAVVEHVCQKARVPERLVVPMRLVQRGPRIDSARHRYGVNRGGIDFLDAPLQVTIQGRRRGRPPGAVETDYLVSALEAHEGEAVTADARRLRRADGQRRRCGYRGIESISAPTQDTHGDSRRQRMGSGSHAIAGVHSRSTGKVEVAQEVSPVLRFATARWSRWQLEALAPVLVKALDPRHVAQGVAYAFARRLGRPGNITGDDRFNDFAMLLDGVVPGVDPENLQPEGNPQLFIEPPCHVLQHRVTGSRCDHLNRESASNWKDFLLALQDRGLAGVEYVVSDDHAGLKAALREVLPQAVWQRCYVHFLRNALDYVPRKVDGPRLDRGLPAGAQVVWGLSSRRPKAGSGDRRDLAEVRQDLARWLEKWQAKYPKLTDWVEENTEETLTYYRLPLVHHKHMKSTNMLERLNQELKRRTHVVRIFPNAESCLRLIRALAVETHENWLEATRYLNMAHLAEHKKEQMRKLDEAA